MKNMNRFEQLAMRARHETPPRVDVSHAVIAILETGPGRAGIERASEKPLMWLAAFSSVFASAAAVLAVIRYDAWVYELSQAISWAMQ
ncbi:MAG: hypothetical protein JXM79_04390 [Sedimentisphaerales bacterium]|nr:hypothetical protein [Sedimentisphaerales bacterium]